jgi:hypothetical protein
MGRASQKRDSQKRHPAGREAHQFKATSSEIHFHPLRTSWDPKAGENGF